MLDRVRVDLRSDQRLGDVKDVRVAEHREDGRAKVAGLIRRDVFERQREVEVAGVHGAGLGVNLGQALAERELRVRRGDLPVRAELVGKLVEQTIVLFDHRVEIIAMVHQILDDEVALLVELIYLPLR